MSVVNKDEFRIEKRKILTQISRGAVYIHPTDTIYGIGCDATNSKAVKKIRSVKKRHALPFSVIAPSKDWIRKNCEILPEHEKWLEKLPGPYTLILEIKNKNAVTPETNLGLKTLGVRMPEHWFSEAAKLLGRPLITTSANRTGKSFMTALENLDPAVKSGMDFIVYEGEKKGRPSTIVDLTKGKIKKR